MADLHNYNAGSENFNPGSASPPQHPAGPALTPEYKRVFRIGNTGASAGSCGIMFVL